MKNSCPACNDEGTVFVSETEKVDCGLCRKKVTFGVGSFSKDEAIDFEQNGSDNRFFEKVTCEEAFDLDNYKTDHSVYADAPRMTARESSSASCQSSMWF